MITDLIDMYMNYVQQISDGNQFLASAIFLWSAGVATIILKDVPNAIYQFIKRHVITTMTLNNGGWLQEEVMFNMTKWLQPRMRESMSRTLAVQINPHSGGNEDMKRAVSVGYGIHFFFYNNRFFWLHKNKMDSSGSERQKDEITIGTIGRSHEPFKKLVDDFTPKKDDSKLFLYHLNMDGDWESYTQVQKRPLNTVAMNKEVKQSVVEQITYMRQNPEWFYERGLPHKLAYILHGPPGGGKTSFIKAIASELQMNICIININQISDRSLERGLARTPDNSIVIMEDFDSSKATADREQKQIRSGENGELEFSTLTLSGLLNALDGVNPLNDCVLFMTTNHLSHIDPALYRKGRVDHIIEIKEVDGESVRDYCKVIFPDHDFSNYNFKPIMGSVLNDALMTGKDDVNDFLQCIRDNGGLE